MEIPMARYCPEASGAAGPWANLCNVYLQDDVPESHPSTGDEAVASYCTFPIKRLWPSGLPFGFPPQRHRTLIQADGSPIDRRQSPDRRRIQAGASRFRGSPFSERENISPGGHQSRRPVRTLQLVGASQDNRLVMPFPTDVAERDRQTKQRRPERHLLRMGALERLCLSRNRPMGGPW